MAILISASLFVVLLAIISYVGYRYYAKPGRFYEQLGTAVVTTEFEGAGIPGVGQPGTAVRVIRILGEKVPVSPEEASTNRKFLMAAGYRSPDAMATFYGIKILAALGMLVVAFLFRSYIPGLPILRILALIAAAPLGYIIPNFVLEYLVSKRQETLRLSLPDALDLMVVCVEAGLGLDQAIVSVARELAITHPELCDELNLVTLEMRAGKRRAEALRNLADRTGEAELRKLGAVLIQTDRFGTSMSDSLRTHSDFLRERRRQEAEERAGKVGVKLVFPIFFLILPSMLVVVAGPGMLQVFKHLFPMMRQFKQGYGG